MTPADLRLQLLASGFAPLPLAGKIPALDAWQKRTETSTGDIDIWTKVFPQATNTGYLTYNTPTLDIDIRNPEAATAIEDLVRSRFEESGYILVRVGNAPKRAIPFRTDAPFKKITCKLIAPTGNTDERLELLCQDQQLAAFGIHPDTGKPYSWRPCGPERIKREDLPHISAGEAQALVDDAAELLIAEHGYTPAAAKTNSKTNGFDGAAGADWVSFLNNLIDHDMLASFAMSLIAGGLNGGAAYNLLRAAVGGLVGVDPERKQRRLDELKDLIRSAEAKRATNAKSRTATGEAVSADRIRTMQFTPIKYVVPGIFVEGLIAALPASRRSVNPGCCCTPRSPSRAAAIHSARSTASAGAVLYCALEDNLRAPAVAHDPAHGHARRVAGTAAFSVRACRG